MSAPAVIGQDVGLAVDVHGLVHLRILDAAGENIAVLVMAPRQAVVVAATLEQTAAKAAGVTFSAIAQSGRAN